MSLRTGLNHFNTRAQQKPAFKGTNIILKFELSVVTIFAIKLTFLEIRGDDLIVKKKKKRKDLYLLNELLVVKIVKKTYDYENL